MRIGIRSGPDVSRESASRPDWRGWIALAWAVGWGWAYALMAIRARSPQVLEMIRALSRAAFPGGRH